MKVLACFEKGIEGVGNELFFFCGQKFIDSGPQIMFNPCLATGAVAQLVRASDCRSEG